MGLGVGADIASLRKEYPEVGWETFEEWACRQDWSVLGYLAIAPLEASARDRKALGGIRITGP